jgi:hypothetical protein
MLFFAASLASSFVVPKTALLPADRQQITLAFSRRSSGPGSSEIAFRHKMLGPGRLCISK